MTESSGGNRRDGHDSLGEGPRPAIAHEDRLERWLRPIDALTARPAHPPIDGIADIRPYPLPTHGFEEDAIGKLLLHAKALTQEIMDCTGISDAMLGYRIDYGSEDGIGGNEIRLKTIRYFDMVIDPADRGIEDKATFEPEERALASATVWLIAADFDPAVASGERRIHDRLSGEGVAAMLTRANDSMDLAVCDIMLSHPPCCEIYMGPPKEPRPERIYLDRDQRTHPTSPFETRRAKRKSKR